MCHRKEMIFFHSFCSVTTRQAADTLDRMGNRYYYLEGVRVRMHENLGTVNKPLTSK